MTEAVQNQYLELLAAPRFGYKLRYESVDPDTLAATDITSRVTGDFKLWTGERDRAIFGWEISLSGIRYDRVLLAPGNMIAVYRSFTIAGVDFDGEILWYEGYIEPASISVNSANQNWSLSVVDVLTRYGRRTAPIFVVGKMNVASDGQITTDSVTAPEAVAGEGEFVGYPSLGGEMAVDGDMSSLWISGKAPAVTAVPIDQSYPGTFLAEIYRPGYGLEKQLYQWMEFNAEGHYQGSGLRIMTRYGIADIEGLQLGEPYGPIVNPLDPELSQMRHAVVGYSSERFSQVFGVIAHAPFYPAQQAGGADWGFNLDDEGDYVAVGGGNYAPGGEGAHEWQVVYVEAGSKMGAAITAASGVVAFNPATPSQFTINMGQAFAENELEGWFVQCHYGVSGIPNFNKQRKIAGNAASSGGTGGFNTVVTVTQRWNDFGGDWDYLPVPGHSARLTPFPYANDSGMPYQPWPIGDRVPPPAPATSNRNAVIGVFNSQGSWQQDDSPQPGWSGIAQDASLWSWLSVKLPDMSFVLSSPLDDGEQTVYLAGTDGMTLTGFVYIGTEGPLPYSDKTVSTITLATPYTGSTIPAGTPVYQSQSSQQQLRWPVKTVKVKRKPVPTADYIGNEIHWRVIDNLRVFASNVDAPRYPGEDNWRDDWINDGNAVWGVGPGNEQLTITFNVQPGWNFTDENGWLRIKHYLFGIRSMIDESRGRINEIEILPPSEVVSDSLATPTVAGFFKVILIQLGIDEANIQTGNASTETITSFSTSTARYDSVLSDLAVRTGQVVWTGPNGDKIRISYNPTWPSGTPTASYALLNRSNLIGVEVKQVDNQSVSQVIVTVMDSDGNVSFGQFPPVPASEGEVYTDRTVYVSELRFADDIARVIWYEKTLDEIVVNTVGPAPWIRPGEYTVSLDWTTDDGIDLSGRYVIKSGEHSASMGGSQPRNWNTRIELKRLTSL